MDSTETAVQRLARIGAQLRERGAAELAKEIDDVIQNLQSLGDGRDQGNRPGGNLITTGEAADILGIRSLNTIKKWAIDGVLEGRRIGQRIMITRESVEQILRQPTVAEERKMARTLPLASSRGAPGRENAPFS